MRRLFLSSAMNPGEKGWLHKFVDFKLRQFQKLPQEDLYTLQKINSSPNSQEFLYHLIQPTGLMYGHPIKFVEKSHRRSKNWSEKEKTKVLMAESYLSLGLYFRYRENEFLPQSFEQGISDIRDFYQQNYARYARPPRAFFSRAASTVDQIEYIFDQRISIRYDWRNFWTSFFHNSLLFFDLIFFSEWREANQQLPPESLKQRRQRMRFKILEIIAAAAHADNKIYPEEREVFNYFLNSAHLPAPLKRKAEGFLKNGLKLVDIDLSDINSWLLKKYFLELAILTSFSNREIYPEEQAFLVQLKDSLALSSSELENSLLTVRDFVDQHWEEVHYLQIKQNYRILSARMIRQMRILVRKNQKSIIKEIQESRELVSLLQKSTHKSLTAKEKEKVRTQLLDILRAIPAFTIFMLPGGAFTLPILLRILPKNILYPSSFMDQDDEEDDI
ncbi:MAG: LETM1 domain-containing protein [Bacteroidia bacterium]